MLLQSLVERAASDEAGSIVVLEGSEHLIPFLGPLSSRVVAASEARGPVLRLCAIGSSGTEDSVRAAARGLGEHDVLVLAMRSAPGRLPVGALIDTLVECGLWVVESSPDPARGVGCALVVTLDGGAPWRSYLLGDTIPNAGRSVLRLLAEHEVEGLAVRAQGSELRNRDRARALELEQVRKELSGREAELTKLRKAAADRDADRSIAQLRRLVDLQEAKLQAVTDELRRAQRSAREARQGGQLKRAARLVRQDPVRGSSRVLRSVLRRALHGRGSA